MTEDVTFSRKVKWIFSLTILIKIVILILFSSGYRDDLFIPFVLNYLESGGNPWGEPSIHDAFPYPPLMLYILSVSMMPIKLLGSGPIIEGIFYGLPLLLSDFLITAVLIKLFPWRKTEVFIFYIASPIILFSTYMHGQLDIIPTAMLFVSVFLLTKKYYLQSAVIIGLAISSLIYYLLMRNRA